jgi:uncharacterized protein
VRLDFLDFSTLAARRAACEAEVRLNRRLAPGIYLGVVPIVSSGATPRAERDAPPDRALEWAVEMKRLDDGAMLRMHLERGTADPTALRAIAVRLAAFHATAERGPHVSAWGTAQAIARNAHENFDETTRHIPDLVSGSVHQRLRQLTDQALETLSPLMERRAASGVIRDTHGDLRVDHVYLLPGGPIAIDCIEFADRYRYADPVSDIAFLIMDIGVRGYEAEATTLRDAWFEASGDDTGRALCDFYVAYRSLVRAKVAGLARAVDPQGACARARRHWLYALATLEQPARRPTLVGVGGLPGTGKSTLAAGLAEQAGFQVIRSDVVRRELLGPHTRDAFGQGAYADDAKDRVYAACLDLAEARLLQGERVVVDASFWKERWRRALLERATSLGVPARILICHATARTVRDRLRARKGDVSDADEQIYLEAIREWEAPAPEVAARMDTIDCEPAPERALSKALARLHALHLAAPR